MNIVELQNQSWRTALFPWENELAWQVGRERTEQNLSKNNRHSYDSSKLMKDNELANVHSAVAEIGTFRLIGGYCYNGIWKASDHHLYKDLPDGMMTTIEVEVKWRRSASSMPVDLKDAELNRLVLWAESRLAKCACEVCGDESPRTESRVRLLGGGYANDLYPLGTAYNGDPKRVAVSANLLTPISELFLQTVKTTF